MTGNHRQSAAGITRGIDTLEKGGRDCNTHCNTHCGSHCNTHCNTHCNVSQETIGNRLQVLREVLSHWERGDVTAALKTAVGSKDEIVLCDFLGTYGCVCYSGCCSVRCSVCAVCVQCVLQWVL